jgi:mRNA interferase RelE/StbE
MYKITFKPSAYKELQNLSKPLVKKVTAKIDGLQKDPRPNKCKKLSGSTENLYRIRIGDYRIVYNIDDVVKIVSIRKIGHRKEIYN